jgi:hypothetical protein
MNSQVDAPVTILCKRYRKEGWRILIVGFIIVGLVYFYKLWGAGLGMQGASQATYVLLTRNIPELRQTNIHLQHGARGAGCDLQALEYCAVLHASEDILDHPDYLVHARQILDHPCDYAISPHEPTARREELMRSAPDKWWLQQYLRDGEPAWRTFGCDRSAQEHALSPQAGPQKFVLNVYRIPPELRQSEIGDLALAGKQVLQFTLYLGN